ncbi:MAG TPA: energy transducer TonB [Vicinamibacterales bacterium]|nr:energy transducer TonB [Vicinamibacterales bacterium]
MILMKGTCASLVLTVALAAPAAAQENSLETARNLYASARYDEALLVLNGLRPGPDVTNDLKAIEQYRSLCLLALGRAEEAEAAISAVIAADPMYQPSEAEASPRVRAAFAEVRQRRLPDISRERYSSAKAAFDRKDFARSEQEFRELLQLIDDPDMGGRLADLRVLVEGFLDLSTAAAAPPPAPQSAEPAPASPPPAPPAAPAPATPEVQSDRVFGAEDNGVVPPVAIKQEVPRLPSTIASQTRERGLMEIVIDEQGRVTHIELRGRMHPVFDSQLIAAAKDWRYRPATFNGRAVKYRKLVQINITK